MVVPDTNANHLDELRDRDLKCIHCLLTSNDSYSSATIVFPLVVTAYEYVFIDFPLVVPDTYANHLDEFGDGDLRSLHWLLTFFFCINYLISLAHWFVRTHTPIILMSSGTGTLSRQVTSMPAA